MPDAHAGRVLVAGWFSFANGHATAGDLLAADLAREWARAAGFAVHVAVDPPFTDGVDWRTVDPAAYAHVVFVCGPFEHNENERAFLGRFRDRHLIGLDLTMLVPLDVWQPFDVLLERDSTVTVRPDVVFAHAEPLVPVVGVCLVEPYPAGDTATIDAAVARLLAGRSVAAVPIDTRLDHNATGLRTPGEIAALVARMDAVVTSRLHGMVLALAHGVPAVVIDPEPGGAKLLRQARAVGWPLCFTVDALDDGDLARALDRCLGEEARTLARTTAAAARAEVERTRDAFVRALAAPPAPTGARVATPELARYGEPAGDAAPPPTRWQRLVGRRRGDS